jgi:hypothetical protein
LFRHAQTPKGPVEAGGRIGVSLGAASTCGPGTDGGAQRRAPDRPQTRRNGAQSLDNRDVAGLAPIPPQDPRYAGDQAALVERPTGRPRMSGLSTECWVALNGERNPRVPRNNIFLLERCARRGPPGAPATASEAGVVGADGADLTERIGGTVRPGFGDDPARTAPERRTVLSSARRRSGLSTRALTAGRRSVCRSTRPKPCGPDPR